MKFQSPSRCDKRENRGRLLYAARLYVPVGMESYKISDDTYVHSMVMFKLIETLSEIRYVWFR